MSNFNPISGSSPYSVREDPIQSNPQVLLIEGIKKNDMELITSALSQNADINSRNANEDSPLFLAISSGNRAIVELLIDNNADIEATDDQGYTSLHQAVLADEQEIIALLVKKGANLDAKDIQGITPYMLEKQYRDRDEETLALLASPNQRLINFTDDIDSWRIKADCYHQSPNMRSIWLATNPMHEEAMRLAEESYVIEQAIQCIKEGANPNVQNERGQTLLHVITGTRHAPYVNRLMALKASPEINDRWKKTPLHSAAKVQDLEVTKALLYHKADVNAQDEDGHTPYYFASKNNNTELMAILENAEATKLLFEDK